MWNADLGDIAVGKRCWLSLNSVIMGPVGIADELSAGPYVEDFRTEAVGSYAGHKAEAEDHNRKQYIVEYGLGSPFLA